MLERASASAASSLAACLQGARVVRVHDVATDGRRDQGLDRSAGVGVIRHEHGRRSLTSATNQAA